MLTARRFDAASWFARTAAVMIFTGIGLTSVRPLSAQVSVLTQHNNTNRTGANLNETVLNPTNVTPAKFGKLFARQVDGEVYAQPLYVPNLTVTGKGTHNVVFVATMNNTLYAFDADDAAQTDPLWKVNFGPAIPASDVQCCCTDISTKIGILSTPVIDPDTATMYVVSRTKNSDNTFHQYLHAISIVDGTEKFAGPKEIAAKLGNHTFDPKIQNQRSALLLSKGVVYIAWASHNDCGPYHGWLMGYSAATLQQVGVYDTTPTGSIGGIWQAGMGPTTDADGNIYVISGNGSYSANGTNLGNSVIKLTPGGANGLTVTDWFTPYNSDSLNGADADLGASGVLGIPGTNYLIGGGKQGVLYLLDRNNMGHFNSSTDNVVQEWQAVLGSGSSHIHGSPVFYTNAKNGPTLYIWGENDKVRAFAFDTTRNRFNTTPVALSTMTAPVTNANGAMPGGFLSVSANGTQAGTGILWGATPFNANANNSVVQGIVHAFDADTLKELWNDKMSGDRDDIGYFAKFCAPTIANGKVYMASFGVKGAQIGSGGQLVVYGLLPQTKPAAPTNLTATAGEGVVNLTWTGAFNATTYNLYRGVAPGGEGTTAYKTGLTAIAYTDTGVTNGTTYYYQVSAVNANGESGRSNEAKATPNAASNLLTTVGDAYVQSGTSAKLNFGTSAQLIVKDNLPDLTRYTYLKFDLTKVTSQVVAAKLRLYGAREAGGAPSSDSVYAVGNTTWDEKTITWMNKPALGSKLSTTQVTTAQGWFEWDVSAYIKSRQAAGAKLVTLAVAMDTLPPDGKRDNFNAKEAGSNVPQLALTLPKMPAYPNGFADVSALTLNGNAKQNGTLLELTDGGGTEAGSAFFTNPVNISAFRTAFSFRITNPNADGMTFTIQGVAPTALGATGGGLGYGPDTIGGAGASIGKSACVKFDLYNNQGEGVNSTGLYTNGGAPTTPATDLTASKIDLHSGHTFAVNMTYNGTVLTVLIRDTTTGATANQSYTVNLPALVGSSNGYVGFTGGTGGLTAIQDVLTWTFTP